MKQFTNFIAKCRSNERVCFWAKVLFFYALMMALWLYFLLSPDSGAPTFIYEQF